MARLRLYNGFTFNQINQQIFYPVAVNPKLNSSGTAFTFSKMEAIVPFVGPIGSAKLVIKGSFKQSIFGGVDPLNGRIESIKLVGPAGTYFVIDNIGTKFDPHDLWLAASNTPLNPTALTDLIFKGGIKIALSAAGDVFNGTNGDDVISGKGGADTIFGNNGNDKLIGGAGGDFLYGGLGNDTLIGGKGNDFLSDFAGKNKFFGGGGNDNIFGGANRDVASGGTGNDTISGSGGRDVLNGDEDDDTVLGGTGADTVRGGDGADLVMGNEGDDIVKGGKGADTLYGNDGQDTIGGGSGQDVIYGGLEKDVLFGGKGVDTFVFTDPNDSLAGKASRDVIKDFRPLIGETIDLSAIDATSALGDQAFVFIGTNAFSGAEGELRYTQTATKTLVQADIDGDGTADFVIALDGLLTLVAGDFII